MKLSTFAASIVVLGFTVTAAPVDRLITQDTSEHSPALVPIQPIINRFAVCLQFENAVACEESCACKPVGGLGKKATDSKMVCKTEALTLGCASNCECDYEIVNAAEIELQKRQIQCSEGEGCPPDVVDQEKIGDLPKLVS